MTVVWQTPLQVLCWWHIEVSESPLLSSCCCIWLRLILQINWSHSIYSSWSLYLQCCVKGHNSVKYHSRYLLFFLSLILNSNHSVIWLGFGFWCSFNSSTISITLLNNHQTIEFQLNNLILEYYNITITGVSIKFDIQLEKSLRLKRSITGLLVRGIPHACTHIHIPRSV